MLGTKIVSPLPDLPDPTLKERGVSLLKGLSKEMLYNPETRQVLPQSMFYTNNLPQVKNGRLDRENIDKSLRLISGFSIGSGLRPTRPIPMGGIKNNVFTPLEMFKGEGKRLIPKNGGWKIDQRYGKQFKSPSDLKK